MAPQPTGPLRAAGCGIGGDEAGAATGRARQCRAHHTTRNSAGAERQHEPDARHRRGAHRVAGRGQAPLAVGATCTSICSGKAPEVRGPHGDVDAGRRLGEQLVDGRRPRGTRGSGCGAGSRPRAGRPESLRTVKGMVPSPRGQRERERLRRAHLGRRPRRPRPRRRPRAASRRCRGGRRRRPPGAGGPVARR